MTIKNQNENIKIGTFFSGIGSPEKALEKLKRDEFIKDYEIMFFSDIDKFAVKSYCAVHNVDESLNLGSITDIKGESLPYCDLWVGGFPCQDISCAGKMKGFTNDSNTRSSLGWEMIRLLKEVKEKPKYIIFENVANITSKAFEDTLSLFKNDLIELGYNLYDDKLCSSDYGIPQNRLRYFLIAILDDKEFNFPQPFVKDIRVQDMLDDNVDEKYYLSNTDYELVNDKRIYYNKDNANIKYEIDFDKFLSGRRCGTDLHSNFRQTSVICSALGNSPTLTACNTAYNSKMVVPVDNTLDNLRIRKITPKEAWKLMGFEEEDYLKASKVCSETNLYHQAGNSIVVNVIYVILKTLLENEEN